MLTLFQQLHRSLPGSEMVFTPDLSVSVGLETKTDPTQYLWDGQHRGGDPTHPFVLFQYTLAEWGSYTESGTTCKVPSGTAFTAVVPSEHIYALPPESPSWTFIFLILRHPYVVSRLIQARQSSGPLLTLTENDPLLARAVSVFEGIAQKSFHDAWAVEAALFEFLFEYERCVRCLLHPQAERDILLAEVRRFVLAHPSRSVEVVDLAEQQGLNRSHFSHRFKAVTGLPPAQWIRQVQLEEATHQLLGTSHTLEVIARASGFADANHLCKVFRRRYHISPSEFRRQMR